MEPVPRFQPLQPLARESRANGVKPEYAYRTVGTRLEIAFRLVGAPLDAVVGLASEPALGLRRDELWRTTCFEVFFASEDRDGYGELNLSPSGDWASYEFDSVRTGMRPGTAEVSSMRREHDVWHFVVDHVSSDFEFPCAVLEGGDGISYWSARPGQPGRIDFHADMWDAWQLHRADQAQVRDS